MVKAKAKKTGAQLDREIAEALQSRVKLEIDDTYLPWRELRVSAHVNGRQVGYLDLRLTKQGMPYPSMVSVDPSVRRRGVATLLYREAARLVHERFGQPLHSDVDRSGPDDAFWQKQVREGRAVCTRKARTVTQNVPFDHIVKGRSGCVRYRLSKKKP